MPCIAFDKRYIKPYKSFIRNNKRNGDAINKTLKFFEINPKHPSLNTEKLSGSNVWSIRIDKGNRLFFIWSEAQDTAIFFSVGPHDKYRTM